MGNVSVDKHRLLCFNLLFNFESNKFKILRITRIYLVENVNDKWQHLEVFRMKPRTEFFEDG